MYEINLKGESAFVLKGEKESPEYFNLLFIFLILVVPQQIN